MLLKNGESQTFFAKNSWPPLQDHFLIILQSAVSLFVPITFLSCFLSFQASSFGKSGEELTARLRAMGFRAILRQDIGYFDEPLNSTGALTTRLATDASRVQGCTGVRAGIAIQSIFALGKSQFKLVIPIN